MSNPTNRELGLSRHIKESKENTATSRIVHGSFTYWQNNQRIGLYYLEKDFSQHGYR